MSVIQRIKGPRRSQKGLQFLKNRLKKNMEDPNQPPEKKKRFPGGFILFLLAAIFILLAVQNRSGKKGSGVSFSHQVEHLVNLDLIDQNEARKTAQNENLVTFTGKFKERLSDDAKKRYRYLELLNDAHADQAAKSELAQSLTILQDKVRSSATLFLQLSGLAIPQGGYAVISPSYDTEERKNGIVIAALPNKREVNLVDLESNYTYLSNLGNADGRLREFGRTLDQFIREFQSPSLGIGDEKIKQQLSEIQGLVGNAVQENMTSQEMLGRYQTALATLNQAVQTLNRSEDRVRLIGLRSVRNYLVDLEQYDGVVKRLEGNQQLLARAKASVADATWFFNNRELSTKMLERQNPEEFSLWFAQAKKEWGQFGINKGAAFKAPDQPRNLVLEKTFQSQEPSPNYFSYILLTILPVVLVILLLYFIFSRQMKGMGSSAMNFGKSPARMLNKSTHKATFKDVAGVDEAKEELQELVDFLKDPAKFTALGARIPKGVFINRPPRNR